PPAPDALLRCLRGKSGFAGLTAREQHKKTHGKAACARRPTKRERSPLLSLIRLAAEPLVFDAMRDFRLRPEAALLVLLVILIVAFKQLHMAVAFKGKHMGGDTVQEPAIMGDDHGASGKIDERIFERTQRFNV